MIRNSELLNRAVLRIETVRRFCTSSNPKTIKTTVTLKEEFKGDEKQFQKFVKKKKLQECEKQLQDKYTTYQVSTKVTRSYAGFYIGTNRTFDRIVWEITLSPQ